ncbi:MAG: PEP-CTERM sorting domain-containing protein [Phycisphaerae bacterium]|nr:PEP-CTERM sorting domain-containing protein [Phycisphaerae bacterium]
MKRIMVPVVILALVAASSNAVVLVTPLRVDFGTPTSAVQEGWQAFQGIHEDALNLYVPREFSAFGTTVTVGLSWNPHVPRWESMQMIDRGGSVDVDTPDLLRDWTGTDGRVYGGPLTLTITGLAAGEYGWLSYHHDTSDQTGIFDVLVVDASGERTFTGIDISDGNSGVKTLAEATKFSTSLLSDGSAIKLTFTSVVGEPNAEKFFVMNGFQIVPEPAMLVLLGLGGLGLLRRRRA